MAQIEPTELAGDEVEVFFVPGQVFSGVTEMWIRPRLRLDPAVGLLDLEQEALWIVLDGEVLEDFELDCVLGSGPHDGDLVSVQGPGDWGPVQQFVAAGLKPWRPKSLMNSCGSARRETLGLLPARLSLDGWPPGTQSKSLTIA